MVHRNQFRKTSLQARYNLNQPIINSRLITDESYHGSHKKHVQIHLSVVGPQQQENQQQ